VDADRGTLAQFLPPPPVDFGEASANGGYHNTGGMPIDHDLQIPCIVSRTLTRRIIYEIIISHDIPICAAAVGVHGKHELNVCHMQLRSVRIRNFRSLTDISFPIGTFSCVIGENNVGKSSLLQALLRFRDGRRLSLTDYYDESRPVIIEAELSEITQESLSVLAEEHRVKVAEIVSDGTLKLVRRFFANAASDMRVIKRVARDNRFRPDTVDAFLKGKKGATLRDEASSQYPEIAALVPSQVTQAAIKRLVEEYCKTLGGDDLTEVDCQLPTGIDTSIVALLPEPIYIPAVKDIADDVKTKDSATFGKILGLLLNVIEPKLANMSEMFAELDRKLNRPVDGASTGGDSRISEIVEVERVIEAHLRENFPSSSVEIRIPPPNLATILSSAQIIVNDGAVSGPVETVGDGLKRSLLFAVFRAYVELARRPEWQKKRDTAERRSPHYLFLYEEPDLYLHPKGQRNLFDALSFVSKDHQVVVTTHSPLFFGSESTTHFAKMIKRCPPGSAAKPHAEIIPVNLGGDLSTKETFQLISFENNNIAFFATDVVLVEGDSDLVALKHIARRLRPEWDFDKSRTMMMRVSGKANFKRFSDFFQRFEITVHIVSDLDVLIKDFDKLGLPRTDESYEARSRLLQRVDKITGYGEPTNERIKEMFAKSSWKEKFASVVSVLTRARAGDPISKEDTDLLELMLEEGRSQPRLDALKTATILRQDKLQLIFSLRKYRIHVLEKGAIEDYYPENVLGPDKISRAEDFVRKVQNREQILATCCSMPGATPDDQLPEFECIFQAVFTL
jgi:putative ATP-dependent endonuclease of OLD family